MLVWFAVVFSPSMALKQGNPFARQYIYSSAASADRVIGSGDLHCFVPESMAQHDVFMAHPFPSFGLHFVLGILDLFQPQPRIMF
jgi:hypothetical protein